MDQRTLFLFPDSNLFIQCKPLQDLEWSAYAEFAEVHLVVCRAVQKEIDSLKNRGRDRVADRARKTSTFFRRILSTSDRRSVVCEESPRVVLYFCSNQLPSKEMQDRLDYSHTDDEILGFMYEFRQSCPGEDVRLLTHDTGPMMAADNLGMEFLAISDDWLLPPENSPIEKENVRLKNEINRLMRLEPEFHIECVGPQNEVMQRLESECSIYAPLTEGEIDELISLLERRFPIVTDFGSETKPEEATRVDINAAGTNALIQGFSLLRPPSERELTEYKNRQYPEWLESCKKVLSNLHRALQEEAGLRSVYFLIENRGTRPGKDALVEFRAQGNFRLAPPQEDFPNWYIEEEGLSPQLPIPPKPPQSRSVNELLANLSILPNFSLTAPSSLLPHSRNEFDPNQFYYRPTFPLQPESLISLSCNQWRHGQGPVKFVVEICLDSNYKEVNGLLECVVQAENLSSHLTKQVPVRLTVHRINTEDYARKLILGQP